MRWTVAAGRSHCLMVSPKGALYAVGLNHMGQLGIPKPDSVYPVSLHVANIGPIKQAAVGLAHSVVLTKKGEVYTFGDNLHGQLGQPGLRYSYQPTKLPELNRANWIAAGDAYSLAVMPSGVLFGWGSNYKRQLGLTQGEYASRPVKLTGLDLPIAAPVAAKVKLAQTTYPQTRVNKSSITQVDLGASAIYDDYQQLDDHTWIGIYASGQIEYGGSPCGFPER
ncbi:MAG: hypothetical protein H7240_02620 [Glaciimonas sp.]|nr:hypothetical protein [Glaciimonas sp.]